jgi:hypothetical protein
MAHASHFLGSLNFESFYVPANPQQQIYMNDELSGLSVDPQMAIMDQQQSQQPQGTYAIQDMGFQNHGQVGVVYGNTTNQHLVSSHHGNVANQHLDIVGQQMMVSSPQMVSNQVYGHDHLMSNQQMITEQNNLINQQRISNMQIGSGHNLLMSDYMSPNLHAHHESLGETAFPDAVEQEVGQMGMTFLEDKDDEIFDCTPAEDNSVGLSSTSADAKHVKPKKPKKKKDPNAPQAAMSAYSFFFKETQLKVKAANPSAKFGDVSRSVSILWERLDETQKAVYRKMQEQDKLRHTKEMVEYKISQGENKVAPEPSSPPKKQTQSIRIVYSDGKLMTTAPVAQTQAKTTTPSETLLPEDKTVFHGDSLSTLKVTKGAPVDRGNLTVK